jgi:fatty-acyl-CoA synthase
MRLLYPIDTPDQDPDAIAFRICGESEVVTYGQLEQRANQAAHVFRACGARLGDHVAILLKNQREFLEICFGAERAGLYYTTMSTRLTVAEIAYIVQDCGAKVLIVSEDFLELGEKISQTLTTPIHQFVVGCAQSNWPSWQASVEQFSTTPISDEAQGLDMLYSSGTTGRPKGVKWPLPDGPSGMRTFLVNLLEGLYGYGRGCRYLSPAPLYHAAPLRHSMTNIKLGGEVFVMSQFDAQTALALHQQHQITHSQWVPTMFVRMLKLPEATRLSFDLSTMKRAIHAAAPCPIDVKLQMLQWWGPVIDEYYAGTENNGFCSITSAEWLQHQGSVGRAALGVAHICDEEGRALEVGATGLVYFSEGPKFEYHSDAVKTAETRNALGWTTLGDIGRLDTEGYLYLVDRKAFMIISGGINIYPQEIEALLIGHPLVADVAVFGIPNLDFGEEVKAVVQLIEGITPSEALKVELIAYCKERLADFKCPRSVDFELELPRHPTGKLYKKILRDRYWPAPSA